MYVATHVLGVMGHILLVCGKKKLLVCGKKKLLVCGKNRFMPLNIVICGVCLALGCLGASGDDWLGFWSCARGWGLGIFGWGEGGSPVHSIL